MAHPETSNHDCSRWQDRDDPWQLKLFDRALKKKLKLKSLRGHLGELKREKCFLVTHGDNNGALNYRLKQLGGEWVWAEFEEAARVQIKDLLHEPVLSIGDGGRRIPASDASFDCVVAIDCHEHLEDPVPFTAELSRITKAGGRVIVTVPNGDERMLAIKIKNFVGMTKEQYGHVVTGYEIHQLKDLLRGANLDPVASSSYSKFFTEMLELCINFAYVKVLATKSQNSNPAGNIAPATKDQLQSVSHAYRLYSLLYPIFRLISRFDYFIPSSAGYAVVVEATKL